MVLSCNIKKNMNVSIICAAYNATYLDSVWQSVKKQTYKNWELIFVIDKSDSNEVRKWYKNRKENGYFENYDVWSIDLDKNRGNPYGVITRNIGIAASSYNYLIFVDEDNELLEDDYLESIVRVEQETGKIIFTNLYLVGKKPGSIYQRKKITHLHRQGIDLSNLFYRKEFFKKYGNFDDSKNKFQFDWDLIEKIKDGEGGENAFYKVDRCIYYRHRRY